jgi:hypothetical protein
MPDCGNTMTAGSTSATLLDCASQCVGDANQMCGGTNSLSLYWNGFAIEPGPTTVQGLGV